MLEFTDQLHRKITFTSLPKRIVSLVPSQTELLYDLGLREEVAGITKFCIHPDEWFRSKTRIGGTKKIDFKKISLINPDLVIGNKEENDRSQIEELMKHYPVWMSDIQNLGDALEMIQLIGDLTGKSENAIALKTKIENQFHHLKTFLNEMEMNNSHGRSTGSKTAYLIWQNPMITVGNDTFIHEMLSCCRLENVFADRTRYPEIGEDELKNSNPDLIFLSSEPFPFSQKHIRKFSSLCPGALVILVDGEMFSWYGSRLIKAPDYFRTLVEQIRRGN